MEHTIFAPFLRQLRRPPLLPTSLTTLKGPKCFASSFLVALRVRTFSYSQHDEIVTLKLRNSFLRLTIVTTHLVMCLL